MRTSRLASWGGSLVGGPVARGAVRAGVAAGVGARGAHEIATAEVAAAATAEVVETPLVALEGGGVLDEAMIVGSSNTSKGGDDLVTLWKAPSTSRTSAADEVVEGFAPDAYPGMGPFLSTKKGVAEKYQFHYQNGLQEFNIPHAEYDRLVEQGVIRVDALEDASLHVPAEGLDAFNQALRTGPPNTYYPQ